MRRSSLVLLVALALPAAALAQYPGGMRGGGMGRGGDGGMGRGGPGGAAPRALPTNAEVEQQDPLVRLMGKREALTLSDSQFTQLARLDATLMEENRPLMLQLDSARNATSGLVASDSAQANDSERRGGGDGEQGGRAGFMAILRRIRQNDSAAERDALALLNADQRARAEKLLEDQRKQLDDAMGRRGGPIGRRGERSEAPPE